MSQWRFFDPARPPAFTAPGFFRSHPWVPPDAQAGHAERTAQAARLILGLAADHPVTAWTDMACGDGALLAALRGAMPGVACRGWDAGLANVARARQAGLDVAVGDILTVGDPASRVAAGDLVSACDVLEHLADPHGWLARLAAAGARRGVFTSPSGEDPEFHYEHHAWAWDPPGYAEMAAGAGWRVLAHVECDAPAATHGGLTRPQRFQAIAAEVP